MKTPSRNIQQKYIQQIVKAARSLNPQKIILFGSTASGKRNQTSDLDICIIKKGDRIKIKRQIWDHLWQSGYDWEIEPDLHVYDPQIYQDWLSRGDPLLQEVERGQVIYAKK